MVDIQTVREWINEHCAALVRRAASSSDKKGPVHYALEIALKDNQQYSKDEYFITYEISDEMASYLYFRSFVCPYTFDIARRVAARNVRGDVPLPGLLRDFASMMISGSLRRPTLRGGSRAENWERDRKILELLDDLVGFYGVTPTRNDETSPNESACDLIASGFAQAGDNMLTYKAVKAIWHNATLREELRLIRSLAGARTQDNPPNFILRCESPFDVSEK